MATETEVLSEAQRDAVALADKCEERIRALNAIIETARNEAMQLRAVVAEQGAALGALEQRVKTLASNEPRILIERLAKLHGLDLIERPVENFGSMPGLRGARR